MCGFSVANNIINPPTVLLLAGTKVPIKKKSTKTTKNDMLTLF